MSPTALHNKVDQIRQLNLDTVCTAENSVTSYARSHLDRKLQQMGYRQIWSPPVEPLNQKHRLETAVRGQASGVRIHSKFPARPARNHAVLSIDSTRLIGALVQVGHIRFLVIFFFGYRKCLLDAKNRTSFLLQAAAEIIDQTGLPALVAGDYNCPVRELAAHSWFSAQNYRTTGELYMEKYGEEMPKTCRESTTHDHILLHPRFHDWIQSIVVDKK